MLFIKTPHGYRLTSPVQCTSFRTPVVPQAVFHQPQIRVLSAGSAPRLQCHPACTFSHPANFHRATSEQQPNPALLSLRATIAARRLETAASTRRQHHLPPRSASTRWPLPSAGSSPPGIADRRARVNRVTRYYHHKGLGREVGGRSGNPPTRSLFA